MILAFSALFRDVNATGFSRLFEPLQQKALRDDAGSGIQDDTEEERFLSLAAAHITHYPRDLETLLDAFKTNKFYDFSRNSNAMIIKAIELNMKSFFEALLQNPVVDPGDRLNQALKYAAWNSRWDVIEELLKEDKLVRLLDKEIGENSKRQYWQTKDLDKLLQKRRRKMGSKFKNDLIHLNNQIPHYPSQNLSDEQLAKLASIAYPNKPYRFPYGVTKFEDYKEDRKSIVFKAILKAVYSHGTLDELALLVSDEQFISRISDLSADCMHLRVA